MAKKRAFLSQGLGYRVPPPATILGILYGDIRPIVQERGRLLIGDYGPVGSKSSLLQPFCGLGAASHQRRTHAENFADE